MTQCACLLHTETAVHQGIQGEGRKYGIENISHRNIAIISKTIIGVTDTEKFLNRSVLFVFSRMQNYCLWLGVWYNICMSNLFMDLGFRHTGFILLLGELRRFVHPRNLHCEVLRFADKHFVFVISLDLHVIKCGGPEEIENWIIESNRRV